MPPRGRLPSPAASGPCTCNCLLQEVKQRNINSETCIRISKSQNEYIFNNHGNQWSCCFSGGFNSSSEPGNFMDFEGTTSRILLPTHPVHPIRTESRFRASWFSLGRSVKGLSTEKRPRKTEKRLPFFWGGMDLFRRKYLLIFMEKTCSIMNLIENQNWLSRIQEEDWILSDRKHLLKDNSARGNKPNPMRGKYHLFYPISLPSTVCICLYWLGIHPFETTIELTERFWTNSSVFFFEPMTSGLQKPKLRILYFTRMGWPVLHQSKVALGAAHGAYEIHRPFFWPIVMGDSYAVASRDGAMGSNWQPENLWAPSRRRWQTNELVQLRWSWR